MEWIKIEDNMPNLYEYVLISCEEGVCFAILKEWGFNAVNCIGAREGDDFQPKNVTHWMSLPEPPTE